MLVWALAHPNPTHTQSLVSPSPPPLPSTVQGTWTHTVPTGLPCRDRAAYRGELLNKYVPKDYRRTSLKHRVLQKVHRGDVRVINDNFLSSKLYIFLPPHSRL